MIAEDALDEEAQQEKNSRSEDEQQQLDEARRQIKQRRVNRLERRWWKRAAINAFLLWHGFALFVWLMPGNSAVVQFFVGAVRPYLTVTAFAQSWSMFSPNPDHLDVYLEAKITYAHGEVKSWEFPRMTHLGYAKKYEEERWRKMTEVVTHGSNQNLWPVMARYAARANNPDPKNPPVKVALIQHSRLIPPPGQAIPPYTVAPLQIGAMPSVTTIRPEDLPK